MTSNFERQQAAMARAHAAAIRASAYASSPVSELVNNHPRLAVALFVACLFGGIFLGVNAPTDGLERRQAWDKAHLECRQSGGAYEYFGSQGYHCIMPKASAK